MSYIDKRRNGERKIRLALYVLPEEKLIIDTKMEMLGLTNLSEFIRKAAVYDTVHLTNIDPEELNKMTMQIGKIGTNINQIAARANTTQSVYAEDIEYLKKSIEIIRENQKKIIERLPKKKDW